MTSLKDSRELGPEIRSPRLGSAVAVSIDTNLSKASLSLLMSLYKALRITQRIASPNTAHLLKTKEAKSTAKNACVIVIKL